jgi:hypothetical protein
MENNSGQMSFSFCQSCGGYLSPENVRVVTVHSVARVLCPDCESKAKPKPAVAGAMSAITTAEEFEEKYKL